MLDRKVTQPAVASLRSIASRRRNRSYEPLQYTACCRPKRRGVCGTANTLLGHFPCVLIYCETDRSPSFVCNGRVSGGESHDNGNQASRADPPPPLPARPRGAAQDHPPQLDRC